MRKTFCRRALRRACGLILLLSVCALQCACGGKVDEEDYRSLQELYEVYASQTRAHIAYTMETSFIDKDSGQSGVLYYLQGESKFDTGEEKAWQSFTSTLLGSTFRAEEYFADGVWNRVEDGKAYPTEANAEDVFSVFPYCIVPFPQSAGLKSMKQESNAGGVLYTLVGTQGQRELLELWKIDLYQLAGITMPDREKESYGNITYLISVSDGAVRSVGIRMEITLFEQAGYTPGYTPQEDDHRLDLTLTAKISLRETGDAVEVPTYTETSD